MIDECKNVVISRSRRTFSTVKIIFSCGRCLDGQLLGSFKPWKQKEWTYYRYACALIKYVPTNISNGKWHQKFEKEQHKLLLCLHTATEVAKNALTCIVLRFVILKNGRAIFSQHIDPSSDINPSSHTAFMHWLPHQRKQKSTVHLGSAKIKVKFGKDTRSATKFALHYRFTTNSKLWSIKNSLAALHCEHSFSVNRGSSDLIT